MLVLICATKFSCFFVFLLLKDLVSPTQVSGHASPAIYSGIRDWNYMRDKRAEFSGGCMHEGCLAYWRALRKGTKIELIFCEWYSLPERKN